MVIISVDLMYTSSAFIMGKYRFIEEPFNHDVNWVQRNVSSYVLL